MPLNSSELYDFKNFRLDVDERLLLRNGVKVQLPEKAFETLCVLVRRTGHLVSKDELLAEVWPDTIVEENSLDKNISLLRRVLGEGRKKQKYIETVRGRGYRFVESVSTVMSGDDSATNDHIPESGPSRSINRSVRSPGRPSGRLAAVVALSEWRRETTVEAKEPGEQRPSSQEVQARRPVSRGYLIVVTIAIAAAAGLSLLWIYSAKQELSGVPQITSVAVLPFTNIGSNPDLEYLSDGFSEVLIDRLSELPQLKVIARSSSFKYRDENLDLQEIAGKLGVQAIVTGKLTRRGDNLFVRVELVDARDNKQLWGEEFNRKFSDALTIESEMATIVSAKLRLKLLGSQEQQLARRGTDNPAALDLVLKADFLSVRRLTRPKALEYYSEALELDPNYALAHARLANTYQSLAGDGILNPTDVLPKIKAAAQRAIELDPMLADSHHVLAELARDGWDWTTAENEYKRALELNPNSIRAHTRYCNYLSVVGRHDEAIAEARRIRELDPQNVLSHLILPNSLMIARRFDEAIGEIKKAIELDPIFGSYMALGSAYSAKGMHPEAIAAFEDAVRLGGKGAYLQICLGAAYARAGDNKKAAAILRGLEASNEYVAPGELAILYEAVGDREKAIATLEEAFVIHDLQLQHLKADPGFDSMHDDPRFQDLLRRIGLPV